MRIIPTLLGQNGLQTTVRISESRRQHHGSTTLTSNSVRYTENDHTSPSPPHMSHKYGRA
jgi:hypothetical protein